MQFVGILALLLGGAAASCLVQGYRAAPSIYDLAVGRIAARRVRSVAVILLLVPLVVVLVVTGLLLFVWHTDPLLRYSHMIWVLALWMVGTLGMYSVFLASHLGLPRLRYMLAGVVAIPLAIYSTPLIVVSHARANLLPRFPLCGDVPTVFRLSSAARNAC